MFWIWAFGGAVGRVPEDTTAFQGRTAPSKTGLRRNGMTRRTIDHIATGRVPAFGLIEPYRLVGGYVNDVSEAGDDALVRCVYGEAKYERLRALERAWDPDNVFRLNQNIRP